MNATQKAILRLLGRWDKPYPPNVTDISLLLGLGYSTALKSLYILDRDGWVELIRDERGMIRCVKLFAKL